MAKTLSQSEKAALLMLSLGADRAANVIKHLSPTEIHKLASEMATVEDFSLSFIDQALEEFIVTVKEQNALIIDQSEYIREMMTSALGEERAISIVNRILPEGLSKGIEQLKWMDSHAIADIIAKEHPQIIAIILSALESEQAAEVMMSIPEAMRADVLMRVATMKRIHPAALRELDQIIEKQIPESEIGKSALLGGLDSAAHILNHIENWNTDIILEQIADQNAELAQEIQAKMFVFEDIIRLGSRDMQTLLREISTSQLLLALKDVSDDLKSKIFSNMSRRAAEMLREDLAAAPPAKQSEIELAQKDILMTVKKLAEAGEIKFSGEVKYI